MYVMPIAFLPYAWFSMWMNFWFKHAEREHHARDPLADIASTSQAALNTRLEPPRTDVKNIIPKKGARPLI